MVPGYVVFYRLGSYYLCGKLYQLCLGSSGKPVVAGMDLQPGNYLPYGWNLHGGILLRI